MASPTPDSVPPSARGAVFLSYAREDTDAARRIADAMRAFGIEAWFDQSELRGGDSWDQKIRGQIRACALFLPIISARTQSRHEGYFRREWKLAVERTHDMAAGIAFIVPVVVDDTPEREAAVPDEFMRVQWTRLAHGVPTPQFVEQVKRLLEAPRKAAAASSRSRETLAGSGQTLTSSATGRRVPAAAWGLGIAIIVIGGYFFLNRPRPPTAPALSLSKGPPTAEKTASAPSEKSIAVLPFANMSAEKENEFFADGVHEDVITNLAKIRDLTIISRTSVLAYRDTASRNLKKIAADLGVAKVVEGSVRRAGNKVKVTAQLIDARTDAHLWAETYDGDLTDIFALQARLAQEIASALKATLTPGERTLIERRPTQNQEAHDFYLRARALHQDLGERGATADYERVVAVYEQAIAKDPAFALAHAQVSLVHVIMYWFGSLDPTPARAERAKVALDAAVRLAPDLPETHLAQGAYYYRVHLDWNRALAEFRVAEAGLPNDAQLFFWLAITHRRLGKWSEALGHFERSVAINPRDLASVSNYLGTLNLLRRWEPARAAAGRFLDFFPAERELLEYRDGAQFALDGDRAAFARAVETLPRLPTDPAGMGDRYSAAVLRGDFSAAEQALADLRLATIPSIGTVINEPVALHRAALAFLRGDHETARQFADQAIVFFRNGQWNTRQKGWVRMAMATAEAWAGRFDVAVREAQAAVADMTAQDAIATVQLRSSLGLIYMAAGRHEEAIACLRQMMSEPCALSPNELRLDPLWSRLKDDPRFEEMLKSAKPL